MSPELYFLAIIPPVEVQGRVQELKYYIREKYRSSHSLNAPPHITLLSPFRLSEGKESAVEEKLHLWSKESDPFEVSLKDFDVFPPRVLFINVEQSDYLMNLQSDLESKARAHPEIFNYNYDERPFHPHLTLAFKDLTKQNFHKAWDEFSPAKFEASFNVKSLFLLHHNGSVWETKREFSLG
jgi:2'-5' RNA ligase